MTGPSWIKTAGYIVSTFSVLMLGIVSWKSASSDVWLMTALIAGMSTSIIGMALRWLSHQLEERREGETRTPARGP